MFEFVFIGDEFREDYEFAYFGVELSCVQLITLHLGESMESIKKVNFANWLKKG
jgi:hypothetical protein